jgi:Ribonuclease G/E
MGHAMSVRILAQTSPGEVRIAAADGADLLDYALWRPGAPDGVGDLHRGRVLARVSALAGAFVAIEGAEGFLPDTEGGAGLTDGAILGVCVIRAAQGGKGPRLSAAIHPDEAAQVGAGRPALLRRGPGPLLDLAAQYPDASVLTDSAALVAQLRPALAGRIEYAAPPLWDEPIAAAVEELAGPEAALPGGGRLSVHPTPALTAIDLDIGTGAGAGTGKARAHEALNEAAIPVLARQIRLRNLSGPILVDWAGLSPRRRAALGPALSTALALDLLRPRLLGFTQLGLAEIVRPRIRPPLHEMLAGPHAAGLAALRALVAEPMRAGMLSAAPTVAAALQADRAALEDFAHLTGRKLALRTDPSLTGNRWRIDALSSTP